MKWGMMIFFFSMPLIIGSFLPSCILTLYVSCVTTEDQKMVSQSNRFSATFRGNVSPPHFKQYLEDYAESHKEEDMIDVDQKEDSQKDKEEYLESEQTVENTMDPEKEGEVNTDVTILPNNGGVETGITIDDMARGFVFGIP